MRPSHYTILEMVDIFRSCVLAELPGLPSSSIRIVPSVVNFTGPHRARHAHRSQGSSRSLPWIRSWRSAYLSTGISSPYSMVQSHFRDAKNHTINEENFACFFLRKNFMIPGIWRIYFSPPSSGRVWGLLKVTGNFTEGKAVGVWSQWLQMLITFGATLPLSLTTAWRSA
jgi:hypothetical protein